MVLLMVGKRGIRAFSIFGRDQRFSFDATYVLSRCVNYFDVDLRTDDWSTFCRLHAWKALPSSVIASPCQGAQRGS